MTAIRLRPATGADREFCYQLHMAAMGEYVAAVWGWGERVQRGFHARAFSPGRWRIITADGRTPACSTSGTAAARCTSPV
jgi:hypothetical protein